MTDVEFVAEIIARLVIDLARNADELDEALKANRDTIRWIGQEQPDVWEKLKARTQARRAWFAATNPLDKPTPANATLKPRIGGFRHGKAQGSLFR